MLKFSRTENSIMVSFGSKAVAFGLIDYVPSIFYLKKVQKREVHVWLVFPVYERML